MQKGSINRVILVGYLGAEPESRYTPSGTAATNFNLATNESWRDKEGEIKEHTEWHRCTLFGKSAEMAKEYLKKGQMVYVEGRLRTRSWEDDDGVKRYATDVNCDMFTMLGKRPEGGAASEASEKGEEEDIPF